MAGWTRSNHFRVLSVGTVLLSAFGCHVPENRPKGELHLAPGTGVAADPVLHATAIRNGADTLFWSDESAIGIVRTGEIAVLGPAAGHESGRLHLVEPATGWIRTSGRLGEGPGELSGSGTVIGGPDWIGVADDRHAKLILFDPRGALQREVSTHGIGGLVLAATEDSIDVLSFAWPEGEESALVARFGLSADRARTVISDVDSAVRGHVTAWQQGRRARRIPGYAINDSFVVVADPLHYRLRYYTPQGRFLTEVTRNVPPVRRTKEERRALEVALRSTIRELGAASGAGKSAARRLDSLDRERLPHFLWPGMGFDRRGRLWVVGEDGDSTFADVFIDGRFASRTILPCARPGRRVALAGDWIVLHCAVRESESSPFKLQLYRIDDG